jgi:hypothetical protein
MIFAMRLAPQRSGDGKEAHSMDPKLTILVMLIGAIIALSHLNEENLGRMRRQLAGRRWREMMPLRRRS